MSRKQTAKTGHPHRKFSAERKRDERTVRRALAKERRNRAQGGGAEDEEEEFVSFTNQLQALGLKLREVPGDGNCLFRALGDQLEGHSRNHLKLRRETVEFMITQRHDFEPFVEDDVPFEKHVASLGKSGTFAGNDAIVAFARNHGVTVVIHQVNAPLWQIRGSEKPSGRELHIAYRHGEHYDSVRRIGDNSESPAHLRTETLSRGGESQVDRNRNWYRPASPTGGDPEGEVSEWGACTDTALILQSLEAANDTIETAVSSLLQDPGTHRHSPDSELWQDSGSGARIFGSPAENNRTGRDPMAVSEQSQRRPALSRTGVSSHVQCSLTFCSRLQVSNKQRKEQQRLEKKSRQEEKHRQRARENQNQNQEQDPDSGVHLVRTFSTLNI
ncbi:OTU domain-containing protein 3-like [Polyodon spathula]|uniref:OTU domain-containing protein 3-like n=1 Tax=Polyodon spathula TaxID=7913 RepID=UPI001B7ED414|nr:OTU domain-containing protein 3-like [Polyodon spathula]